MDRPTDQPPQLGTAADQPPAPQLGTVAGQVAATGHAGYLALLDEMAALHRRKAADYGSDADPLANVRGSVAIGIEPWRAAWLRALDKVHRVNRFCLKGELACEGVEDSLMDLAAYALIALALMRERLPGQEPPGQKPREPVLSGASLASAAADLSREAGERDEGQGVAGPRVAGGS